MCLILMMMNKGVSEAELVVPFESHTIKLVEGGVKMSGLLALTFIDYVRLWSYII